MNTRLIFLAGALLLAACQFQAHTTVQPDGSGELRIETGLTDEERRAVEEQAQSEAAGKLRSPFRDVPESRITVKEERRGDRTWRITTTQFDNLNELQRLYEQQSGVAVNRLTLTDERFVMEVTLDTTSTESALSSFEVITWTVTLPGAPIAHNATSADGKTLTWVVQPKSGTVTLRAESAVEKPAPAGLPGLALIALMGAGAVLGGLIVLAVLVRLRRPPNPR
jgi:hypothetical protein